MWERDWVGWFPFLPSSPSFRIVSVKKKAPAFDPFEDCYCLLSQKGVSEKRHFFSVQSKQTWLRISLWQIPSKESSPHLAFRPPAVAISCLFIGWLTKRKKEARRKSWRPRGQLGPLKTTPMDFYCSEETQRQKKSHLSLSLPLRKCAKNFPLFRGRSLALDLRAFGQFLFSGLSKPVVKH